MPATHEILSSVPIPKMVKVRQKFEGNSLTDVHQEVHFALDKKNWDGLLKKGMRIAVTAGSRGIANMPVIIKTICEFLKEKGCQPFVVPAMGSHGGATKEGQFHVLESLGITEKFLGVPIDSSMDTECIYEFEDGFKVFSDACAFNADGIVVVNRIKPHTSFRGIYESGLMKMMCVGLGNQLGADQIHKFGPKKMGHNIERGGRKILESGKIICGVAVMEDSYDQTSEIKVLFPNEILEQEPTLLERAKSNMPKILFENIDVLIIDRIGKDISGTGMDQNITFAFSPNSGIPATKRANRIVVLDLTDETHGAAVGMGKAEFVTRRLYEKINFDTTYSNLLTAGFPESGRIPMIMDNQKMAIQAGIKTAALMDMHAARVVRISDTLHLGEIEISESMLKEAQDNSSVEVIGEPYEMVFCNGDLF